MSNDYKGSYFKQFQFCGYNNIRTETSERIFICKKFNKRCCMATCLQGHGVIGDTEVLDVKNLDFKDEKSTIVT